jgi:thermitase
MSTLRRLTVLLASAVAAVSVAGATPTAGALVPRPAPLPVASADFDPHTVLVAFASDTPAAARAALHAANGGTVASTLDFQNLDVVRLPKGVDPRAAALAYGQSPLVEFAEPNYRFVATSVPNDSSFKDLYGLHNTGQTGGTADADVDAPEGWDMAYGPGAFPSTGGVRVGIVDTGIDRNHVDVGAKTKACASALSGLGLVTNGVCADDNIHGTHVAGTIGAFTNNGVGVAGAAPNADLAICKALNAGGAGLTTDIVACVRWLRTAGGARIISMSLGSKSSTASFNKELADAYAAGVLLIAAAGNDGDTSVNYPAAHPDVMSVAATDAKDARASFSNCNGDVEIAAPGVNILSTTPGGTYTKLSGTSMATPHVSGIAAVVMWKKGLSAAATRTALTSSADDKGAAGRDTCFGYGRANLAGALQ